MFKLRTLFVVGLLCFALSIVVSSVSAQGGGYTPENVVTTVTADGFIFQSYNRPNGTPYSGGQRIRIAFDNGNPFNICRTNGAGENGTLLGAFVFEGEPFAIVKHFRKGLILVSPTAEQLATEPRRGRTPICEVSQISGDANDEDFTIDGLGQFVVNQIAPGGRFELLLNGDRVARTNNSGNGDALRLLIYENRIPVILAQNSSGGGCTFHTSKDLGTGGTDIALDRRLARNLEVHFPDLCGTDLIPDGGIEIFVVPPAN